MTSVAVPPSRLNPTDATLWDIERNPHLRTTIVAAIVLDRPVGRAALLTVLEAATREVPRLRQRVVEGPLGLGVPHWEIDPRFDLNDHVTFAVVAGPVDDAAIAAVAEPMVSTAFDRDRPLWECTYMGGTTTECGRRAALVLKVHHSLTDGVGGIRLLDVLLTRRRAAPLPDLVQIPIPRPGRASPTATGAHGGPLGRALVLPFDAAQLAVTTAFHPQRVSRSAWKGMRSAARLLAPSFDPLSPLMVGRSTERHVTTAALDLDRLCRAAARHGCTINDAFVAGAVGGIAAYHREMGAPTERLRITMPVSSRRADHARGGNQWAPVRFVMPANCDDPVALMRAASERMRISRSEPALSFSQTLAGIVQMLPSALSSGVVGGMVRGADVTLTNVPGFTEPHFLAGASVEGIHAFAPTAGAALNVAMVSNRTTACVGTLSDAAAVSDPALLQASLTQAFIELIGNAGAAG